MNTYASDHEQWELIKVWWKANGKMVIVVALLAMLATYGFRYWQQRQELRSEEASMLYQQLLLNESRGSVPMFTAYAQNLENNYPGSPYASLAAMWEAKLAVAANNLALAEQKLLWAMKHSKSDSLAQIARLRAARVLLAQNKPDAALDLLKTVDNKGFTAAINQLSGDIYLAKGDKKQAKSYYEAALKSTPAQISMHELLKTKDQQLP